MKKILMVGLVLASLSQVACGRRSNNNNNNNNNTACTQNVSYDQYGRPVQGCVGTFPNGQTAYGQYGYGQYGYGQTGNPYGYTNNYPYGGAYSSNVGMTGNPCAPYTMQYGGNYVVTLMNGQWMCVQR